MKRIVPVSVLLAVIITATAYAHKGEVHSYMGTITKVTADGFALETKDGKEHRLKTSKDTTYTHSDNHKGRRAELKAGTRAGVKISNDGRTATNVKFAATAKSK